MHGDVPTSPPPVLRVITVLLLAANILFLWMFFAADSIPQLAAQGHVSGGSDPNLLLTASLFAARWKHGMAGNSLLYMPGFFAVGVATWLWSLGVPLRRLGAEWLILAVVATVVAAALAPLGSVRAVQAFEHAESVSCRGPIPGVSPWGAAMSLYTLFTWSAELVCLQIVISRRSPAPLVVPVVLNILMLQLRPWAVNDFTTQWIADVSRGDPVAVVSVLAVPVLLSLLLWHQLRREHPGSALRRTREDLGPCGPSPTP